MLRVSEDFFFQAADGIRDVAVTGVQTCALPILRAWPANGARRTMSSINARQASRKMPTMWWRARDAWPIAGSARRAGRRTSRSEERRVGKEGRSGWGAVPEGRRDVGGTRIAGLT